MYALKKTRWSSFILRPQECSLETAGAKGFNLKQLSAAGFNVPEFIVIPPAAFWASLSAKDRMALRAAQTADEAVEIASRAHLPAGFAEALERDTQRIFGRFAILAVRSSACDEDGDTNSFAGQLDSVLGVKVGNIAQAVLRVWLSALSERNLAYRSLRGATMIPQPPAVIIQRMIQPDCAGVAFSADPVSGNRQLCVVNAVSGLADVLVSGESCSDTFYIDKAGNVVSSFRDSKTPSTITEEQAERVAALARRAETLFGAPQDIEWAIDGRSIHILQSRPITTLKSGEFKSPIIWDNSNIGESYQGVTTPLTFSFARKAYEHVYIQFCRMMGVPEERIAANAFMFPNMIGFIEGRIYYNLLNWYRLISILPGFKTNRAFMEQMMGVSEALPPELVAQIAAENPTSSFNDRINLARSIIQSAVNLVTLPRQVEEFNKRFEAAMAVVPENLNDLSLHELIDLYRGLENKLLLHWDAPLTNDFFAMIFYGMLRKQCKQWCNDEDGTMQNALLSDMSGVISKIPAIRIQEMAAIAREDKVLLESLKRGEVGDNPEFRLRYKKYLDRFGDRCISELKLESPSLKDDPTPLIRSIYHVAISGERSASMCEPSKVAEESVAIILAHHPVRKAIFNFVLKNARERVRQRENLRFQRTRLFGLVRRIFTAIGRRYEEAGVLEQASDVFFLELNEIFGCVEGTATTSSFKGLVAVRKRDNARYLAQSAPPDRFQTSGPIACSTAKIAAEISSVATDGQLKGMGCSPGRVVGPVRILRDPHLARPLEPGEIVVADRTDPGWILVFPQASGLLVEHGSLLSHSAIVSRELGLPAIVSIKGITSWLLDGDLVEMDGSTGVVRKLEKVS